MNITMIHTSLVSVNDLNELVKELIPDAVVTNMIDDSLLREVKANNGITDAIISRMSNYTRIAKENGADIIFNQCSSVGEAFDQAVANLGVRTLKIDEPMAEKAIGLGSNIAVVATVYSTMAPSCNLVKNVAKRLHKEVTIGEYYVDGALDILMKEKNVDKHNTLVLETIKEAQKKYDVIVLAQGSMAVLQEQLKQFDKPVLTSPRLAIERLAQMAGELDA